MVISNREILKLKLIDKVVDIHYYLDAQSHGYSKSDHVQGSSSKPQIIDKKQNSVERQNGNKAISSKQRTNKKVSNKKQVNKSLNSSNKQQNQKNSREKRNNE